MPGQAAQGRPQAFIIDHLSGALDNAGAGGGHAQASWRWLLRPGSRADAQFERRHLCFQALTELMAQAGQYIP